jgi:hypothetical protein
MIERMILQYDAHDSLYRRVPPSRGYAGVLTTEITKKIGSRCELLLGLSEGEPLGHTQDVSFLVALRL